MLKSNTNHRLTMKRGQEATPALSSALVKFRRISRGIHQDQSGLAYVEFALFMPIFLIFLFGGIEFTRYLQIHQKLEKAVYQLADIVAQSENITVIQLNNLADAMDHIIEPYAFDSNARIFISSVSRDAPNQPTVRWQYCNNGLASTSAVGTRGSPATLPAGLTLDDNEDVIIAEIFYRFSPLLSQTLFPSKTLYKRAIYRPRLGALDDFVQECS
jgi:Flp pilus assembly protein TadG